jgi:phosphoribosyl-AMP cyclohydrolase
VQGKILKANLKFDDKGLIPAIIQDSKTGEVLMLGYMNRESLELTLKDGEAWFFSRSRQELWHKGATSGNFLKVEEIRYDCDGDAVLVKARPMGSTCHTGERSCFFRQLEKD